ncbi:MAG: GAF domain-containing sensor histidine kinase [Anaerolineae bacterium]
MVLLLLGVGLFDAAGRMSPSELASFVVAYAAYNLVISVLLLTAVLNRAVPTFTLFADTIAVLFLLYLSGGSGSPFFWVPLFPILVASLRFGWWPGLLEAVVFSVAYLAGALLSWERDQGAVFFVQPALFVLLFLVAGMSGALVRIQGGGGRHLLGRVMGRSGQAGRVGMIYEMASTLSATLNYQRVLEAILDISRVGFDELDVRIGESVGLVLLYGQDGYLAPAAHRNLIVPRDATRHIEGKSGIVDEAIGSARGLIGGAPVQDPELQVFESLRPCRSMICVPLRAGFETFGALLFASVKSDIYTPEHVELLTIFCNQATIALQNASLYQSLREERDKIVDREEQARNKLARDLHDGPTQDIAAIAMRLNFARFLIDREPKRARAELARLEDLAHRTVKEIRSMLFTLRPVILETEGLLAALSMYAENLQENNGQLVQVEAEQYEECLDLETQGVVFTIMEEAINNARKHAEAAHIWVRLAVHQDLFVAQVADDGQGFDVQAVEGEYASQGSLGMLNMQERATLIGGTLDIKSEIGNGTRVTLLVPLDEEA